MRDGWEKVSLAEVARSSTEDGGNSPETPFVGLANIATGSTKVRGFISADEITTKTLKMRTGDVLFGKLNPHLRKVAVAPFDGACSPEILVWRTTSPTLMQEYLCLLMQSAAILDHAVATGAGTGMKRTSAKSMSMATFLRPPLEEQQLIVDLIGSLDEAIDAAEVHQSATEETLRSVSEKMYSEHVSSASLLLGDVAEVKGGKRLPAGSSLEKNFNGAPYIRVVDVKKGLISQSDMMYVPASAQRAIDRYRIYEGEIFVSIVGTIGEVAVCPASLNSAFLTENAARIITRPETVRSGYIHHYLRSSLGQSEIDRLTVGTTQKKLALIRIKQIRVPCPGLAQQSEAEALLDALNDTALQSAKYAETLRATRSELLSVLLSGEHVIPESYDVGTAVPLEPAA